MGSVPNCQKEIADRYPIRWFKCKLKPPKNYILVTFSLYAGLKVVGEVKKVGKSRNFHPKVGKSRNFSVLKVGKSRKFIHVFITSLHTGTSIMLVSFIDFEANHLFSKKCTFYTKLVATVQPYCVLLIANYCLRTKSRLNSAAFLAITCNIAG